MRLAEVVASSRDVAGTSARLEKIERLASLLRRLPPGEIGVAIAFWSGSPRQGRVGMGAAAIMEARAVPPAGASTLDLMAVDARFQDVAAAAGSGSARARIELLRDLFRQA